MLESFTASVLRQSVPRISRKSGFVPKKRHASYCKLCLLNWLKTLCLCCTQQVFSKALIWQWRALCVWWISPPKPVRLQSKHSYCGCDIIFVLVRNTSVCGWTCAERLEDPSKLKICCLLWQQGGWGIRISGQLACLSVCSRPRTQHVFFNVPRRWTSGKCLWWMTSTRSDVTCCTSCWAGDFLLWSSSSWSSCCLEALGGQYMPCTDWCKEMCKCAV